MTKPPTSDAAGAVLRETINPKFWIDVIRTQAHVTDCREKRQALKNAADKLEAYIASTPQPPPEAGSVKDRKQWGYALERCIESQRRLAKGIDNDNPGDPWAALSVWEDVTLLEAMHAAFFSKGVP